MLNIHELRVTQNFNVIYPICKREKIEFFLMLDVIKLLQSTLDKDEDFFDKRIEFKRVKDKKRLENLIENNGHLLLSFGNAGFCIKDNIYFLLKEIHENQIAEDRRTKQFNTGKKVAIKRFT